MRKKKGWSGQSKRHSNAKKYGRAGGRYARKISPPLESESIKLPIQLSITVPTTKDKDKKISPLETKRRVENTAKEFSDKFGGDTAVRGKGDYTTEGVLIREDVIIVESSMTKEQYLENKSSIEQFIKESRSKWEQDRIAFKFEGDLFLWPEKV